MNLSIQLFANVRLDDSFSKHPLILLFRSYSEFIAEMDTAFFTLFHMNSMELRFGEYGGRNISFIFNVTALSFTAFEWYDMKLSSMTKIGSSGFNSLMLFKNRIMFSF